MQNNIEKKEDWQLQADLKTLRETLLVTTDPTRRAIFRTTILRIEAEIRRRLEALAAKETAQAQPKKTETTNAGQTAAAEAAAEHNDTAAVSAQGTDAHTPKFSNRKAHAAPRPHTPPDAAPVQPAAINAPRDTMQGLRRVEIRWPSTRTGKPERIEILTEGQLRSRIITCCRDLRRSRLWAQSRPEACTRYAAVWRGRVYVAAIAKLWERPATPKDLLIPEKYREPFTIISVSDEIK